MYDERFHITFEFGYAVWLMHWDHTSSLRLSMIKRFSFYVFKYLEIMCPFFRISSMRLWDICRFLPCLRGYGVFLQADEWQSQTCTSVGRGSLQQVLAADLERFGFRVSMLRCLMMWETGKIQPRLLADRFLVHLMLWSWSEPVRSLSMWVCDNDLLTRLIIKQSDRLFTLAYVLSQVLQCQRKAFYDV